MHLLTGRIEFNVITEIIHIFIGPFASIIGI